MPARVTAPVRYAMLFFASQQYQPPVVPQPEGYVALCCLTARPSFSSQLR